MRVLRPRKQINFNLKKYPLLISRRKYENCGKSLLRVLKYIYEYSLMKVLVVCDKNKTKNKITHKDRKSETCKETLACVCTGKKCSQNNFG